MALAHSVGSAVEAAYRRTDLFDKRRRLMEAWAEFCAKGETDAGKMVRSRSCANTAIASRRRGAGYAAAAGHLTTAVRPARAIITSSWAVKAVIMARKRPLPEYNGALAEPIYVDMVSGEPDEWIKAEVIEKMTHCAHTTGSSRVRIVGGN